MFNMIGFTIACFYICLTTGDIGMERSIEVPLSGLIAPQFVLVQIGDLDLVIYG